MVESEKPRLELGTTGPQLGLGSHVSPGVLLASERTRLGLSVGDVAAKLRMSVQQVEALERAEYDKLPSGVFLRGFVKSYAKLVSLDPDTVVASLAANQVFVIQPALVTPSQNIRVEPARDGFSSARGRALLLGALCLTLVVGVGYWWRFVRTESLNVTTATPKQSQVASNKTHQADEAVPAARPSDTISSPSLAAPAPTLSPLPPEPVGVASSNTAAPGSPPTPAQAASAAALSSTTGVAPPGSATAGPNAAPTAGKLEAVSASPPTKSARPPGSAALGFSFKGESWVEVTDAGGRVVLSRRFKSGESESLVARKPLTVVVGNAPATQLLYDDLPFELAPHTKVSVARFVLK